MEMACTIHFLCQHCRLIVLHILIYDLIATMTTITATTTTTTTTTRTLDNINADVHVNVNVDFDFDLNSNFDKSSATTATNIPPPPTQTLTPRRSTQISTSAIFMSHSNNNNNKIITSINSISNNNNNDNDSDSDDNKRAQHNTGTISECVHYANVNAASDIVATGDNCSGTAGAINVNVVRVNSNFPNENQIINAITHTHTTLDTSVAMPTATNAVDAAAVAVICCSNNNNSSSVLQTEANDLWPLPSSTAPAWLPSPLLLTNNPPRPTESSASMLIAAGRQHSYPTAHESFQSILSRPKRYLAFPEGASFSASLCITVGVIGNPRYNYMSYGLNWGVAYDLPNTSWVLNHLHGFSRHPIPVPVYQRRERRYLYSQIERFIDNMGFNGRECVLRTLCESRRIFTKSKMNMIGEMLRVIFSLPKQRLFTRELHEKSDIEVYDYSYRKARSIDCSTAYDCPFSLVELATGKYSTPPPGYYEPH